MQASKTSDSKGPLAFGELWTAATPRSLRAWREASRKAREEREVDFGACRENRFSVRSTRTYDSTTWSEAKRGVSHESGERVKHADLLHPLELRVLHTLWNSGAQPPRSAPLHVVLSQVRVLRTLEEADSVLKQSFPTGSSIKKRNYRQMQDVFHSDRPQISDFSLSARAIGLAKDSFALQLLIWVYETRDRHRS